MHVIADLHIHSSYAQGAHRDLSLETIALWAKRKGIHVVGTGDWTHPRWWSELRAKLIPAEDGLFRLRTDLETKLDQQLPPNLHEAPLRFVLGGELATIYEQDNKVRKVHHLLFAPDFARAQHIQRQLEPYGDLSVDGRPTLSLSSRDLLALIVESSPRCHLIPAHIWHPWNGLLGSTHGFDTVEECYGDMTPHIFALETGLSSVPSMSRRCSQLDSFSLVSFSNARKPEQLGREATLIQTSLSYDNLFAALKQDTMEQPTLQTLECYPERGRYFLDGHQSCETRLTPTEYRTLQGRCPVCQKPLTQGVLHRIEELSDRTQHAAVQRTQARFMQLLSLPEILSEILEAPLHSSKLRQCYLDVLREFGSEFTLLRDVPIEDIHRSQVPLLSEAIQRVRAGYLQLTAGYDGEYGKVRIFKDGESKSTSLSLFEWVGPSFESSPPEAERPLPSGEERPVDEQQPSTQLHLFPVASSKEDLLEPPLSGSKESVQTEKPDSNNLATKPDLPSNRQNKPEHRRSSSPGKASSEKETGTNGTQPKASKTEAKHTDRSKLAANMSSEANQRPPLGPPPRSKPTKQRVVPPQQLLAGLNTEQRAAVLHKGSPLQLVAGPGTGKTRTLIHRLAYQIASRQVLPQHAVVLTFTHEAANHFQRELFAQLGSSAHRVFVGTFYKFCLRLLQDFRADLLSTSQKSLGKLPPDLPSSLLGAFEKLALLEAIAEKNDFPRDRHTLRYSMDRITWAKQNLFTPEDLEHDDLEHSDSFLSTYRSYQKYLARNHRYDLDDLLFETVRMLRSNPDRCQLLQLQFRAFVIDEYQELNEAQYRLLRFVVSDFAELSVAGDPDQHVYAYCGSQRKFFDRFVHDFSPPHRQAVRLPLWRNYRSPETVLDAAHQIINKLHDPQRVQTLATHSGPLFIPISVYPDPESEAQSIALQIQDFAQHAKTPQPQLVPSIPEPGQRPLETEQSMEVPLAPIRGEEHYYRIRGYRDIAILYRSSQQLPSLERALREANIPYQLTRSGSITSHGDMQLLLGLLRCLSFPHQPALSLPLVLQYWPGVTNTTRMDLFPFPVQSSLTPAEALSQAMENTPVPPDQHAPLQQLTRFLKRIQSLAKKQRNSRDLLECLVDELGKLLPPEALPSGPRLQALLALSLQSMTPQKLLQYLLIEHAPNIPPPLSDSVSLLPIRASKGREFPVVILPGCEEGLLPWKEALLDPAAMAEERRLFFLGMTRCSQVLWLTQTTRRVLLDQPHALAPSRFLKDIQPYLSML